MSTALDSSKSEMPRVWLEYLSFASPESDFVSSPEKMNFSTDSKSDRPAWSDMLSFAFPESDFVSASKMSHMTDYATESNQTTWSESLSFASPESDFVSASETFHLSTTARNNEWSESLSFASAESDFVSAPETLHVATSARDRSNSIDSVIQEFFQSHHLYLSPETAAGFIAYTEMIDETILTTVLERHSLPKTMKDALNDERPIVVTTVDSPFSVVDVNGTWESLCGYRRDEAIGRGLGSLLQGPATNMESANTLVRSLQKNGFSETVITNYAKNGRRFENHVQIGIIPVADDGDISSANDAYFVGVLNDIIESSNEKVAMV
jgi:PAS domain S-box-containing protein